MLFADSSHGRPFSKDPAVVRFAGKYWLYYSLPPYKDGRSPDGLSIGVATSTDLEDWQVQGEIRPEADYEANGLCAPGAIVLDGQVHLFYQTYGNGPKDAICHAVSSDGLSFTRNPSNPIFHPTGDWNVGRAIDADVIPFGDRLLLYFATRDPHMKIQMLGVASAPLDSDFGREHWVQLCDQPILKPELPWEGECIEAPALFRRGERLFMFYGGAYNNWPQQIGLATSTDGVQWQRVSDQPFLPNGEPGSWNACESGHPFAFTDQDGSVTLFYQGDNDMGQSWYLSSRKIGWRDGLPILI
jgi:beta-1,2-mannobiose phosphorylase / 1,2-beta-oligomannan phosphorylase